jgi:gliding motility-associated-like protein
MTVKLLIPFQSTLYTYVSVFILFFCSINVNAQCAGNDNILPDVCDITTLSSQSIDLSALLGVHTLGGTWNDDDVSGGLNTSTGILNAQLIKKSGVYRFTYTLNNVNGCTDTAVTTITIGGYTGIGSSTNACSDDASYSLFQAFNGNFILPQEGGTWTDVSGSGGLDAINGILNATIPPTRINYTYIYTIDAIASCPQVFTPVQVYISPKPLSGTNKDLNQCSGNLSTNYNLNDLLIGEDSGGIWTELSGTNELTSSPNIVNIQNIYNTKGAGSYSFKYTVKPERPICLPNAETIATINIEQFLDLTGATLTVKSNRCEDEITNGIDYKAILTQGMQSIVDGSYLITYKITNHVTGLVVTKQTTSNLISGVLNFDIPSNNFQMVSDYTVEIVDFKIESGVACTNIIGTTAKTILSIFPLPKINNATLKIDPVCQTSNAIVSLLGTSNLRDGDYDILYNLTGSNIATAIQAVMNVLGGEGNFPIPSTLIPNAGTTTITITGITNKTTRCTNLAALPKDFIVNPLPVVSSLAVTIKPVCQGKIATVNLKGLGSLTSIIVNYSLSGVNNGSFQTMPLTVVVPGEVTFDIPANDIQNVGSTTFTVGNVTNSLTGCSSVSGKDTTFEVNTIPATPVADAIQSFCSSVNATVANLKPQGNQYQWFDSATSTIPLIGSTPLISGNYFVKEVNALTKCESGLRPTSVVINTTPQINTAIVAIPSICQGVNANVNFATGTTNLTDGNYDILYNLSGSNTTVTPVSAILSVTNGIPSFIINSSLIPNAGNTTIAITNIANSFCSNTSTLSKVFVINALPDVSTMVVTVKNGCLGQPLNVQLSGLGTLSNITLSYAVSGANTIGSQTIPLVVSAGNANFLIPSVALSALGDNTLIITDLTNTGNSCATIINSVSKNFVMQNIPSSPTASNQEFCETNLATVANLIPNGNQYKWYTTATDTAPLASNALLETTNYFLKEGNTNTGCESNATPISILINSVAAPVLSPSGQDFCGVDKPTIQNLSNNTTASGNLAWYDTATNGTLLNSTNLLKGGFTYYGIDSSTITNCRSYALEVTVSLTDCTATPENFFIPDGFSPNGDGVNETFQIIDIEFLFPNYTLEIFNRYGNILFKGDINKPAWDGKNSNTNLINGDTPTGVYFYIIHYNKDNLPPKQGQLYLNR